MASSFGKMPTTSARRLISPLSRSIGIGRADLAPTPPGKVHESEDVDLGLIEQSGEPG
jgi:hypothetical protein